MAKFLPPMEDLPMSLGDHLHELRRRIILPLIAIGVLFLAAFAIEGHLKLMVAQPMSWAIDIDPELAEKVGLKKPPKFGALDVLESAMVSMSVSFYAAIFVAFPILVYQLWMFVGVGLLPKERRLAFLFIPAGIMFFYAGTILGYFIGLPHYYAWMIKWTAHDPTAVFMLTLKTYHKNFVLMTMIFGVIADIPWLIMVLVRVGLVSIEQLRKHRKMAILINTVIAGLITPPDGVSMLIMMVPLLGLFELGLLLSRLMMWHHTRMEIKEAKAAAAAEAAAEKTARELAPQPGSGIPHATPEVEQSTTTSQEDGPIARDHVSAETTEGTSADNYQDDAGTLTEHVEDSERDPAERADVEADKYRDDIHHDEPVVTEPPAPRGMDEAGMFGEEQADQVDDADEEDRRD